MFKLFGQVIVPAPDQFSALAPPPDPTPAPAPAPPIQEKEQSPAPAPASPIQKKEQSPAPAPPPKTRKNPVRKKAPVLKKEAQARPTRKRKEPPVKREQSPLGEKVKVQIPTTPVKTERMQVGDEHQSREQQQLHKGVENRAPQGDRRSGEGPDQQQKGDQKKSLNPKKEKAKPQGRGYGEQKPTIASLIRAAREKKQKGEETNAQKGNPRLEPESKPDVLPSGRSVEPGEIPVQHNSDGDHQRQEQQARAAADHQESRPENAQQQQQHQQSRAEQQQRQQSRAEGAQQQQEQRADLSSMQNNPQEGDQRLEPPGDPPRPDHTSKQGDAQIGVPRLEPQSKPGYPPQGRPAQQGEVPIQQKPEGDHQHQARATADYPQRLAEDAQQQDLARKQGDEKRDPRLEPRSNKPGDPPRGRSPQPGEAPVPVGNYQHRDFPKQHARPAVDHHLRRAAQFTRKQGDGQHAYRGDPRLEPRSRPGDPPRGRSAQPGGVPAQHKPEGDYQRREVQNQQAAAADYQRNAHRGNPRLEPRFKPRNPPRGRSPQKGQAAFQYKPEGDNQRRESHHQQTQPAVDRHQSQAEDAQPRQQQQHRADQQQTNVNKPVNEVELDDEKLCWFYSDPDGQTRGPFSTKQLVNWVTVGRLPWTLGIWKYSSSSSPMLISSLIPGIPEQLKAEPEPEPEPKSPRDECVWMYEDGRGEHQGPVPLERLKEFPPHIRVWRAGQNPDDGFLIRDLELSEPPRRERSPPVRFRKRPVERQRRKRSRSPRRSRFPDRRRPRRQSLGAEEHHLRRREWESRSRGEQAWKNGVRCVFFDRGRCKNGNRCEFLHV